MSVSVDYSYSVAALTFTKDKRANSSLEGKARRLSARGKEVKLGKEKPSSA